MVLSTAQVIDRIFKDPIVKHGLQEFKDLGKAEEVLNIYPKQLQSGTSKGETRYYLKCLKRGIDIQVYCEKKSNAEEIVRQLWLHKLSSIYGYPLESIEVEYPVNFGTITADKAADILVYQKDGMTAKIIIEVKKPERKDGLNQLKSYLNAEGSPVGVWSNGLERVILYRPYPKEFEDTLTEIPTFHQEPKDVFATKLVLEQLKHEFDFKRIIQNLEELVLANAGKDEFNEIFKIIFAKIYDEKAAIDRKAHEVKFRKSDEPQITYETVDKLFRKAMEEWPGIFDENDHIKLAPQHLQVVIGPLERIKLMGANMRVMDDAFEYLMPSVLKKKQGQFFTPRYVIDMCVKMLNPKKKKYVLDPACGSAGFLLHVMEYVWPANTAAKKEERKNNYAARYLWGFDFGENPAKVSRALMLIAGDGRTHIFRINSLDPREWFADQEGESLRNSLREANLLAKKPVPNKVIKESEAWDYFKETKFDLILTNPPFAGEIRDRELLKRYELAGPALARKSSKGAKEERDVLFIERCLHHLKPGGRMAIVLPQGKFNNATLAFIREWLIQKGRVFAVVGLHPNTFKPHTGTKTSVLFLQKYTADETAKIDSIRNSVQSKAPNYSTIINEILASKDYGNDLVAEELPREISTMLREFYEDNEEDNENSTDSLQDTTDDDPSVVDLDYLQHDLEIRVKAVNSLKDKLSSLSDKKSQEYKETKLLLKTAQDAVEISDDKLTEAQRKIKQKTVKGRLELLLNEPQALNAMQEKWIDVQIAKELNYPIFMAVSQLGGKDSSGDYIPQKDTGGTIITDDSGNPLIEQDCIRYREGDRPGIAEHFEQWAKKNDLSFWQEQ